MVEGLSFTGFYSHYRIGAWSGINGIQLGRAKKSVIRNCRAFFNANGISLSAGEDSVIDNCVAFANGSQSPSSGGNIIGWSGIRNEIRNCLSMYKIFTGGSQGPIGIRFYGVMKDCKIINCRSFGEDGINIKGTVTGCYAENNYCERHINVADSRSNLHNGINGYNRKSVSLLQKLKKSEHSKHFADPENHDYRPLKSVTIGMPEKILSGQSLLLPPQAYPAVSFTADNVTLATRGAKKRAVLEGGKISGSNIRFENLEITAPLTVTGKNICFRNCVVTAKLTVKAENTEVTHCRFTAAPDFTNSTGFRHSNIGIPAGSGLYSLEDAGNFDGFVKGPNRIVTLPPSMTIIGPFVHAVSDTSADIEWWTSSSAVASGLQYGESPKCEKRSGHPYSGGNWHSVTVTDLKPGQKYFFKINNHSILRTTHSSEELTVLERKKKQNRLSTKVQNFTTASEKPVPRVLKVTGKEITPVLDKARPGDTVMIKGGVYSETLYVRSSGVTLRNMPGEKVYLDGKRTLASGIILENKPGTVIDGLFFREFIGGDGAGVVITGGKDITLRRCFYDGRSSSYTPVFVKAKSTSGLTVEHSVILRGFHGTYFYRCPDLIIRNCVWSNNQVGHMTIYNQLHEKALFTKNIMLDIIPGKIRNSLTALLDFESLKSEDNCYYFRIPLDKRRVFSFARKGGKAVSGSSTIAEFASETKSSDTFTVNPGLPAVPRILQYKSADFKELAAFGKEFASLECGLKNKVYTPWDFNGFFPGNAECIKRGLGPDKKLFRNGAAN